MGHTGLLTLCFIARCLLIFVNTQSPPEAYFHHPAQNGIPIADFISRNHALGLCTTNGYLQNFHKLHKMDFPCNRRAKYLCLGETGVRWTGGVRWTPSFSQKLLFFGVSCFVFTLVYSLGISLTYLF